VVDREMDCRSVSGSAKGPQRRHRSTISELPGHHSARTAAELPPTKCNAVYLYVRQTSLGSIAYAGPFSVVQAGTSRSLHHRACSRRQ
jgi:hypothetical protein